MLNEPTFTYWRGEEASCFLCEEALDEENHPHIGVVARPEPFPILVVKSNE